MHLTLRRLSGAYFVNQVRAVTPDLLEHLHRLPESALWSMTHTATELSIVSPVSALPGTTSTEGPWACFEVAGPLEFSLVGIVHHLTTSLRAEAISVFVLSTYDTDYLLVKEERAEHAARAWEESGVVVES